MHLNRLNAQQKKAVTTTHVPLLVLAGAGSGKTSVITQKIIHLIKDKGIKPNKITAVTFTNKAAKEMKERVSALLDRKEGRGLSISTFHNLGLRFLGSELAATELRSGFSIFDSQDCQALIADITNKHLASNKEDIFTIQNQISEWKNNLVGAEAALSAADTNDKMMAAKIYLEYQKRLTVYNAVDFDDLIFLPVKILEENPQIKEKWQQKIHYLLVDEYQDTNVCQYQFVKLICGQFGRLTAVGDDDQSIYSWRGACPENLALLAEDFSNLEVIKLEQNYRSVGRILKVANTLIDNNPHVFDKKLWSDKAYGDVIRVISPKNEEQEAKRIASEIISYRYNQQRSYRDYAVLYRNNHQSNQIEKALTENQIPYKISGGTSFFARSEIKDIMSYFRLLINPDDDTAFLRIINVPRRQIGSATLAKLNEYASKRNSSLFAACFELGFQQQISSQNYQAIERFTRLINDVSEHCLEVDAEAGVAQLVDLIDYKDWLFEQSSSPTAAEFRWSNVCNLLDWIAKLSKEKDSFKDVIASMILREMLDRNEAESQEDQVHLLTLHAAKGLEFPHVYIIGVEEGILPHHNSMEPEAIEEERRLAYVGITRAQKTLTLSVTQERKKYGEKLQCEPSRFLAELPEDDLEWESKREPLNPQEQKEVSKTNIAALKALLSEG